jgi:hypothetical protein
MQSYTEQLQQKFAMPQRISFGDNPMELIEYDVNPQMVKKLRGIYQQCNRQPPDSYPIFHPTQSIEHFLFFLDGFENGDEKFARQYNFDPFGLVKILYSCAIADDGESTDFVITFYYPRLAMTTAHIRNLLRYAIHNNFVAFAQKLSAHPIQPPFRDVVIRLDSDTDRVMNFYGAANGGYDKVYHNVNFGDFSEHFVRSNEFKNEFELCHSLPLPVVVDIPPVVVDLTSDIETAADIAPPGMGTDDDTEDFEFDNDEMESCDEVDA